MRLKFMSLLAVFAVAVLAPLAHAQDKSIVVKNDPAPAAKIRAPVMMVPTRSLYRASSCPNAEANQVTPIQAHQMVTKSRRNLGKASAPCPSAKA